MIRDKDILPTAAWNQWAKPQNRPSSNPGAKTCALRWFKVPYPSVLYQSLGTCTDLISPRRDPRNKLYPGRGSTSPGGRRGGAASRRGPTPWKILGHPKHSARLCQTYKPNLFPYILRAYLHTLVELMFLHKLSSQNFILHMTVRRAASSTLYCCAHGVQTS